MTLNIDLGFYRKWRKFGETAVNAARLARGSEALADGALKERTEYDPEGCSCDYTGEQAKYCHLCKENKRREHEGRTVRRHKCSCPYTYWIRVESPDGEFSDSIGGVCVNSADDPYIDYIAADLAANVVYEMSEAPAKALRQTVTEIEKEEKTQQTAKAIGVCTWKLADLIYSERHKEQYREISDAVDKDDPSTAYALLSVLDQTCTMSVYLAGMAHHAK